MSPNWKQLYETINDICEIYEATSHPQSMKDLIFTTNHTIEKMVIMGLGDNWWQLAMILALNCHFLVQNPQKANIDVFCQEDYNMVPKGTEGTEGNKDGPYPDNAAGRATYMEDCLLALEKHFLKVNTYDKLPSPGPVVDEITSRTLLYTPLIPMHFIAQALKGRDPELYIGNAMDVVEGRCEAMGMTELKDVARNFREKREWKRLAPMPTVVHNEVELKQADKKAGQMESLYIYRRRSAGTKAGFE